MNVSNKITGIIPTFNEENHIEAAIDSLNFTDEIIVLDSFSTDTTVERAKSKGAKITLLLKMLHILGFSF